MDVTLYKDHTAEKRSLTRDLTEVATYEDAQVVGEVTADAASIRLNIPTSVLKWSNTNYFKWDGAYYFIQDVIMHVNGSSTVVGAMDYLYTYRDQVRGWVALLEREVDGTERAVDEGRLISADATKTVLDFPIQINTSESSGVYVIVTSQKGFTTV